MILEIILSDMAFDVSKYPLCNNRTQHGNVHNKLYARWQAYEHDPPLQWNWFGEIHEVAIVKGPISWNWGVPHVKLVNEKNPKLD